MISLYLGTSARSLSYVACDAEVDSKRSDTEVYRCLSHALRIHRLQGAIRGKHTWSNKTWLLTFSFILPFDHFCKNRINHQTPTTCDQLKSTKTILTGLTFFFPLLLFEAAKALASLLACGLGACTAPSVNDAERKSANR